MSQTTLDRPVQPMAKRIASGTERRRSTRESVGTPGFIRADKLGARSRQVIIADVSLHGVGLHSTSELKMGSRFFVEIGVGPLHLSSRFEVVRSRQREDGMWDIGGEFC